MPTLDDIETLLWRLAPRAKGTEVQRITELIELWAQRPPIPRECARCQDKRLNKNKGKSSDGRYILHLDRVRP